MSVGTCRWAAKVRSIIVLGSIAGWLRAVLVAQGDGFSSPHRDALPTEFSVWVEISWKKLNQLESTDWHQNRCHLHLHFQKSHLHFQKSCSLTLTIWGSSLDALLVSPLILLYPHFLYWTELFICDLSFQGSWLPTPMYSAHFLRIKRRKPVLSLKQTVSTGYYDHPGKGQSRRKGMCLD